MSRLVANPRTGHAQLVRLASPQHLLGRATQAGRYAVNRLAAHGVMELHNVAKDCGTLHNHERLI